MQALREKLLEVKENDENIYNCCIMLLNSIEEKLKMAKFKEDIIKSISETIIRKVDHRNYISLAGALSDIEKSYIQPSDEYLENNPMVKYCDDYEDVKIEHNDKEKFVEFILEQIYKTDNKTISYEFDSRVNDIKNYLYEIEGSLASITKHKKLIDPNVWNSVIKDFSKEDVKNIISNLFKNNTFNMYILRDRFREYSIHYNIIKKCLDQEYLNLFNFGFIKERYIEATTSNYRFRNALKALLKSDLSHIEDFKGDRVYITDSVKKALKDIQNDNIVIYNNRIKYETIKTGRLISVFHTIVLNYLIEYKNTHNRYYEHRHSVIIEKEFVSDWAWTYSEYDKLFYDKVENATYDLAMEVLNGYIENRESKR